MKGRWNKALSLLVTAAMTVSLCAAGARAAAYGAEPVRVIVEMEDAAVLESAEARAAGASAYARSDGGTAAAARLLSAQKALQQRIVAEADRNAEVVYTYTSVFNGFSLRTDAAGVSAIRAMEGVKNVYPVRMAQITDPAPEGGADDEIAGDGSGMLPSGPDIGLEAMWDMGYDGRGQVIAVIDSELDVTHPMFAGEVEDPALTLEGLETLLAENTFNADASAKRLYRSSKLPFVYDYYDRDTDTYNSNFDAVHGTHVSGIAAGRDGELDGESVSGMAPQAQLVFMKVGGEDGQLPDDAAIAAIDDAAKLGVCAINMSFGTMWKYYSEPYEKSIAAAKAAGILLSVAIGNSSRGDGFAAWADMPDYDASGMPDSLTGSLSVAAYEPAYRVMNYYTAQFRHGTEEETVQASLFGESSA